MIESLSDRSQYPVLETHAYLNQASLGLIGAPALDAMHSFLDDVAKNGNIEMSDSDEVEFFLDVRARASRLMNCAPDRLAITAGASEILGQLPSLLNSKPGSEVILVSTDFPALTRPWINSGWSITWIDDCASTDLTSDIIERISRRTAVVAVSHVQFATGTMLDISRLRAATSALGAALVVDVTQSAGACCVDASSWDADAVVSSGYKWLGGHGGVAVSCLAEHLIEKTPTLPGWMGAPLPFHFDAKTSGFAPSASRFTLSTMSYVSMVGLSASLEEISRFSCHERMRHAGSLGNYLLERLAHSKWTPFRALDDQSASPHIIALEHPHLSSEKTVGQLRNKQIYCTSRNSRVRVSIAPYTNSSDLDRLVRELTAC